MSKDPGYSDSKAESQGSRIRSLEKENADLKEEIINSNKFAQDQENTIENLKKELSIYKGPRFTSSGSAIKKLQDENAKLTEQLKNSVPMTEVQKLVDAFGCGSNSCYYVKPTGMATNGPCRCRYNLKEALDSFKQWQAKPKS